MSELTKEFIEDSFPRVKIGWKDEPVLRALNRNIKTYENNWKKVLAICQKIEHCKEKAKKKALVTKHKKYLAIENVLDRKDIDLRKRLGIYLNDPCGGRTCHREKSKCPFPEIVVRNGLKILWCGKHNIPAEDLVGRLELDKKGLAKIEIALSKKRRKR